MSLISDTAALAAFVARQAGARFVTVDTEFMRDRTFWPILCLVQVAGPEEAAVIDAMQGALAHWLAYRDDVAAACGLQR